MHESGNESWWRSARRGQEMRRASEVRGSCLSLVLVGASREGGDGGRRRKSGKWAGGGNCMIATAARGRGQPRGGMCGTCVRPAVSAPRLGAPARASSIAGGEKRAKHAGTPAVRSGRTRDVIAAGVRACVRVPRYLSKESRRGGESSLRRVGVESASRRRSPTVLPARPA